ncbi:MAG: LPS export ABC transporter periplasmic protein LptC [Rhodocyclaceae bacterium]|nr:LPS export ABC transporter periplasmic protein LptC [Rhodocyclaceae bacterium]
MRRSLFEQIVIVLVLLLLAAGTSWLVRVAEPDDVPEAESSTNTPDMLVERFTLQRFDAHGRRQYVFSAARMRHYAAPERTELDHPELLFLGGEAQIQAQAIRGTVSEDGETVRLSGDVVMSRAALPDRPAATLTTQALTVWPETERVAGRVPVRYEEGRDVLVAGRFDADNLVGELRLGDGITATFRR